MESILQWVAHYGYAGLFGALVLGIVGLPIPDETILVFCGYLVGSGRLNAVGAFAAGLLGSMFGITLSYLIGRTAGHAVLTRYGKWLHLTSERVERIHQWFLRAGDWLLTFGYFIVGVRHFTALVAGMSGLDYPRFALFAYPGAALWVASFLTVGYFVGEHWRDALVLVHHGTWALAAVVAVIAIAVWFWRRRVLCK